MRRRRGAPARKRISSAVDGGSNDAMHFYPCLPRINDGDRPLRRHGHFPPLPQIQPIPAPQSNILFSRAFRTCTMADTRLSSLSANAAARQTRLLCPYKTAQPALRPDALRTVCAAIVGPGARRSPGSPVKNAQPGGYRRAQHLLHTFPR